MRKYMFALVAGAGLVSLAGVALAQTSPMNSERMAPAGSSTRSDTSGQTTATGRPYSSDSESSSTGRVALPSGASTGIGATDAPR